MFTSKIETKYDKQDKCDRICQGDILRDFSFNVAVEDKTTKIGVTTISFPYIVILSQDCDLEQSYKNDASTEHNQYLPNVLFIPAFPSEDLKEGKHLQNVYNIVQRKKDKDLWKPIRQNLNERYHSLTPYPDYQIPDLIIDFKLYQTIPTASLIDVYESHYLATINELFRENLSHRFSFFLSRIALPDFKIPIPVS